MVVVVVVVVVVVMVTRWMAVKLGVAVGLCLYGGCGMCIISKWCRLAPSGTLWHHLAPSGTIWHVASGIWYLVSGIILHLASSSSSSTGTTTPPPYLPSGMHVWVECMGGGECVECSC